MAGKGLCSTRLFRVGRISSEVLLHEAHAVHCLCNPETRRQTVQGWHKMAQKRLKDTAS